MMETADDPIGSGVPYSEGWLEVQPGVQLKVMEWAPPVDDATTPLVFVAGWVSVVEGWRPLLEVLARRQRVVYIETREKRSAKIDRSQLLVRNFTVARLADDLKRIADRTDVDWDGAIWFGSSMGSNAIIEALKGGRLPGRGAFLVGPNACFRVPRWGRPMLFLPSVAYHPAKSFVLWYIRRFRVNANQDPEQMRRYERTLNAADPIRLKLSARAVIDYTVWPSLETVQVPVAIAFAASDTLHGEDEARAIVARLPLGTAVECPSNTYMHRADVAKELDQFIASLD
jgi:pimeloyl-ACP methyl ester carboxylesterase